MNVWSHLSVGSIQDLDSEDGGLLCFLPRSWLGTTALWETALFSHALSFKYTLTLPFSFISSLTLSACGVLSLICHIGFTPTHATLVALIAGRHRTVGHVIKQGTAVSQCPHTTHQCWVIVVGVGVGVVVPCEMLTLGLHGFESQEMIHSLTPLQEPLYLGRGCGVVQGCGVLSVCVELHVTPEMPVILTPPALRTWWTYW